MIPLLFATATLLCSPAVVDTTGQSADERLVACFDPRLDDERAAAQLASLGSTLPAIVIAHVRPNDDNPEGRPLGPDQLRRVELGLARLARRPLAQSLAGALAGEDPPMVAYMGLNLLATIGGSEEADLAAGILHELGRDSARIPDVMRTVERAFGEMQRRDSGTSQALARSLSSIDAAWLVPIARAFAQGNSPQDLEFLWAGIARGGQIEPAFLAVLGDIARTYVGRVPEQRLAELRARLRAVDMGIVEHAVVCLGRLGDDDSTEQLVALMTQANPRIRRAAHWGMREITGLPFGSDARRWEDWLAQSRAWWAEHGGSLAEELRFGPPEVANARVIGIAAQRLHRDELVHLLTNTFEREEDSVADLAIRAMRELRCPGTQRQLIELLDHPSARVQGRAWRALRDISGFDAGPEREDWRRALLL